MSGNPFKLTKLTRINEKHLHFSKRQWLRLVTAVLTYGMLISLSVIFLVPFAYMAGRSVMSAVDLANINVEWLPRRLVADNYVYAVKALDYGKRLVWSLFIAFAAVAGQVFSSSFVGYGLARIPFKGRGVAFALILFSLLVPPQTIILSQYLMFAQLGFLDSAVPLVAPALFTLGLNGGLFVFLFRQFYKGMPRELEDAALIDGAGTFGAYFRIILPNSASTMLVSIILSFIWQWNNYFEPTVFIKDMSQYTLSMMLSDLWKNAQSAFTLVGFNQGINMAATVLCALPPVLVFLILQRRFIKGIETTGLAN